MFDTDVLEDEEVEVLIDEQTEKEKQIIIYNDDFNTFQHVIECLMKYCGHLMMQAEQCAHIIHNNGKCAVKNGAFKKLKPICEALTENGLDAKIE